MGWMGTAFSYGLNLNDFFIWVEWERLFHMGWMRTAFSTGLDWSGFFIWVECERLFRVNLIWTVSWMKTALSYVNENELFQWRFYFVLVSGAERVERAVLYQWKNWTTSVEFRRRDRVRRTIRSKMSTSSRTNSVSKWSWTVSIEFESITFILDNIRRIFSLWYVLHEWVNNCLLFRLA
jgi:hypothetical protein